MVDAWEFPESLWESTDEGIYLPEQLFNVDYAEEDARPKLY